MRGSWFGILATFCLGITSTLAWNDTGHQIVAAIAYARLTPAQQKVVDDILTSHPKYSVWKNSYHPGTPNESLGLHVFLEASTWPDLIRNYNDPSTRADWHFIDYPLRPPSYKFRAAPAPTDNAVYGIGQCISTVSDEHAGKQMQAEYLSFLIHFVGDIHQPLHCESMFNSTFKAPQGDRGGNFFYVKMHSNSTNSVKLHYLWDSLPGSGTDPEYILSQAAAFVKAHPVNTFPAFQSKAPVDWSKESRLLAIDKGYKPLPSLDGTTNSPVVLPGTYFQDARDTAEKQVTLAGYRLAEVIQNVLADRVTPTP
jgi:hypothetical protein